MADIAPARLFSMLALINMGVRSVQVARTRLDLEGRPVVQSSEEETVFRRLVAGKPPGGYEIPAQPW